MSRTRAFRPRLHLAALLASGLWLAPTAALAQTDRGDEIIDHYDPEAIRWAAGEMGWTVSTSTPNSAGEVLVIEAGSGVPIVLGGAECNPPPAQGGARLCEAVNLMAVVKTSGKPGVQQVVDQFNTQERVGVAVVMKDDWVALKRLVLLEGGMTIVALAVNIHKMNGNVADLAKMLAAN